WIVAGPGDGPANNANSGRTHSRSTAIQNLRSQPAARSASRRYHSRLRAGRKIFVVIVGRDGDNGHRNGSQSEKRDQTEADQLFTFHVRTRTGILDAGRSSLGNERSADQRRCYESSERITQFHIRIPSSIRLPTCHSTSHHTTDFHLLTN